MPELVLLRLLCRAAARRNHFDNDETEILLIPDLEADGEDDIVSKGEPLTLPSNPIDDSQCSA